MPTGGSTVDEVEDGVEDELSYLSDRPSRPEETVYLQHKRSHLVTILVMVNASYSVNQGLRSRPSRHITSTASLRSVKG